MQKNTDKGPEKMGTWDKVKYVSSILASIMAAGSAAFAIILSLQTMKEKENIKVVQKEIEKRQVKLDEEGRRGNENSRLLRAGLATVAVDDSCAWFTYFNCMNMEIGQVPHSEFIKKKHDKFRVICAGKINVNCED